MQSKVIALIVGIVVLAGVVLAIVLTRGDDESPEPATQTAENGCETAEKPEPKTGLSLEAPAEDSELSPGDAATAVVETSCGSFSIELDTDRAPITANSFAYLANQGFYDNQFFHRIAPGFVIQGGDPLGTGSGGPGYSVDEAPPQNLQYTRGIVAMAKSAAEPPGRSGSQFFVVTGAAAPLPPDYALVGKVSDGLDVVETIGELGNPQEQPTETIVIESVTIEEG